MSLRRRLGTPFDPYRQNNFDLLRFVAAALVLVDHSFVLTGRHGLSGPLGYDTLGGFAVAIFFVISGFLVAASWDRQPRLGAFARKRALRLLPAYAAVVTVCALVLGPVFTSLTVGEYLRHAQTWDYFCNLTFFQLRYALPGVFAEHPYPHAVNGSLWTLPIELAMYIVLAALGRAGLLTRRGVTVLVGALAVLWFGWNAELSRAPPLGTALPTAYTLHLALWFFSGSALWFWRDRVIYRPDVAAVLLAAAWLARGSLAGGLLFHVMVPYVLLWFAQLPVRWMNRFGRRGDFSYGMYLWAFPVQQTFAPVAVAGWPQPVYLAVSLVVTLACAALSWHAVEHPALRRKTGRGTGDAQTGAASRA